MSVKIKYLLIVVTVVICLVALTKVSTLFANYATVDDLKLTVSNQTLKTAESVQVTVSDSNTADTKVVIPISEDIEYVSADNKMASVVLDTINHQLVIDWLDPSSEQKSVTVTLNLKKQGNFQLQAITMREEQEVASNEVNLTVDAPVNETSESTKAPVDDNSGTTVPLETDVNGEATSESDEQKTDGNKNLNENNISTETEKIEKEPHLKTPNSDSPSKTGVWGTSPWSFDEETGTLTIEAGELSESEHSPWRRDDKYKINYESILKIVLNGEIKLPLNSFGLFTEYRPNVSEEFQFPGLVNLKEIEGMSNLDTSNVEDMNNLFRNAFKLKQLDLSSFDTRKVKSMWGMFNGASSLEILDISNFITSEVKDMGYLFKDTTNLKELDISNLDTSEVTNMNSMFDGATSLTELDLSGFKTIKATGMGGMFSNTPGLKSLNLSNFETENVTNMGNMFSYSNNLVDLNISNFDTRKVRFFDNMFNGLSKLKILDINGFSTSSMSDMTNMFSNVNLQRLVLGNEFEFAGNASLGLPVGLVDDDNLTGKWIREDGESIGYKPDDFMTKYGTDDLKAGSYIAEKYTGELGFKETPDVLSFKDAFIPVATVSIARKDVDFGVAISDTRNYKNPWQLKVSQVTPFESEDGDVLPDILLFRQDGKEDQWLDATNSVNVYTEKTDLEEDTRVSWSEKEGFFLEVPSGIAKAKKYMTQLQWNLEDVPI